MRELYRQEMEHLGAEVERMGRGVQRAITRATTSLREGDLALAEQTIDADERLDAAARGIDEMCVSLLALQGPVASDLRLIVGALRLAQTMERQGDLARHLAQIARSTHPRKGVCPAAEPLIGEMCKAALSMADMMVELLTSQDVTVAERIMDADDRLDDLQVATRRLVADPDTALTRQEAVDLTLAARFLERFGDHTVSVARRVTWIVQGV